MSGLMKRCLAGGAAALAMFPAAVLGAGAAEVAAIVKSADAGAGLWVHLGCGSPASSPPSGGGALTVELAAAGGGRLAAGGELLVQGLTPDRAEMAKTRRAIRARGLGAIASAEAGDLKRLPYATGLVNFVVADDVAGLLGRGLTLKEVFRVLAPGGAAVVGGRGPDAAGGPAAKELTAALAAAGFDKVAPLNLPGVWLRAVKPRGGDLNAAGPPACLQWQVESPTKVPDKRNVRGFAAWNGRLAELISDPIDPRRFQTSPRASHLICRDARNGLAIWRRPVDESAPPQAQGKPIRFGQVPMTGGGGRFYLVLAGRLTAIDADTGKTLKVYDEPIPNQYYRVHYHAGMLFQTGRYGPGLRVIEAETGRLLWTRAGATEVAFDGGRVFAGACSALDPRTGATIWSVKTIGDHPLLARDGRVFFMAGRQFQAISARDGKVLWTGTVEFGKDGQRLIGENYPHPEGGVYYAEDHVWTLYGRLIWLGEGPPPKRPWNASIGGRGPAGNAKDHTRRAATWIGLEAATGKQKNLPWPEDIFPSHRCFGGTASERLLLTSSRNIIDARTGRHHWVPHAKGACLGVGFRLSDGLVYSFPTHCGCFPMFRGYSAFAPADEDVAAGQTEGLTRGPAYGEGDNRQLAIGPSTALRAGNPQSPWPCFRHDAGRSGATSDPPPGELAPLWTADIGGSPTGCVAGGGMVLAASGDDRRVVALKARTGAEVWAFEADGRIDTPPTLWGGLALLGDRGGTVYALSAADGRLAWRFRAAPRDRRIVFDGQLESPWPVTVGVITVGDLAYFVAGRGSEVDGGFRMYCLEPRSGKVRWVRHFQGQGKDIDGKGRQACQSRLAAALAADGRGIEMYGYFFDPASGEPVKDGQGRFATVTYYAHRSRPRDFFNDHFTRDIPGFGLAHAAGRAGPDRLVARPDPGDPAKGLLAVLRGGKVAAQVPLPSAPVWGDIVAAYGRVYVATQDGRLRCYGKKGD